MTIINKIFKGLFILIIFLLPRFSLFAQENIFFTQQFSIPTQRYIAIENALNSLENRNAIIDQELRKVTIELTLEYVFAVMGKQTFELLDEEGGLASRLTYPNKGQMTIFKGEVGFLSKFFIGGRYGSSDFRSRICDDEDWNLPVDLWDPPWPYGTDEFVDYQITKQDCKSKVEFFDINIYYRFLDLDKEEVKQRRLASEEDTIFDYLLVDSLSLDVFVGYQQQKGRYNMVDPLREYLLRDEGIWYYVPDLPADTGLNSFYKVEYKGPRLGLRAKGSKGKVTTRVWFAYAWLETKAHGWWNLRDLQYWQRGENGYGIDLGWDITYPFTNWLSAGLGFNYLYCQQNHVKMYAVEDGTPWWEGFQERVKDVESVIYGPSFVLKIIW